MKIETKRENEDKLIKAKNRYAEKWNKVSFLSFEVDEIYKMLKRNNLVSSCVFLCVYICTLVWTWVVTLWCFIENCFIENCFIKICFIKNRFLKYCFVKKASLTMISFDYLILLLSIGFIKSLFKNTPLDWTQNGRR